MDVLGNYTQGLALSKDLSPLTHSKGDLTPAELENFAKKKKTFFFFLKPLSHSTKV